MIGADENDPVVGHGTVRNDDGTLSHQPLRQSEADALLAAIAEEQARLEAAMPTEASALRAFYDAYKRLKDFGWRDAVYCPKDGSTFDMIEPSNSAPVPGHYDGAWPEGVWWAHDAGDLWPSRPALFRLQGAPAAPATTPPADVPEPAKLSLALSDGAPLTSLMHNVLASRIAKAWKLAGDDSAGDSIDRGLALRRRLEMEGFELREVAGVRRSAAYATLKQHYAGDQAFYAILTQWEHWRGQNLGVEQLSEEEVKCSTGDATMRRNQAHCSTGDGSGLACLTERDIDALAEAGRLIGRYEGMLEFSENALRQHDYGKRVIGQYRLWVRGAGVRP